jgi:dynein heavy chain
MLVGEWEEGCTTFQKMLFIRSCRPDRISFCITAYIVRNLNQNFVEPPVLDLKAALDDSTPQTPLIFVLSPGVDPISILMQLADSQDMTARFMMLSLGQGQAPIATRLIINLRNTYSSQHALPVHFAFGSNQHKVNLNGNRNVYTSYVA